MNDGGWEARFRDWAEDCGWSVTKAGWPDFLCRRGTEVMAVEVKASTWLTDDQKATLATLYEAGISTYVWVEALGLRPYPKVQRYERSSQAALLTEIGDLRMELEDALSHNRRLEAELRTERSRYLNDGRTQQIARMSRDLARLLAHHQRRGVRTTAPIRRILDRYSALRTG